MKLLGREPALVIAAVNALIMLGGTLGFALLGNEQAALWVTAVNAGSAAIVAWATRPLSPAVFAYLVASLVALAGGYGLDFTPEFVNGLNLALVPILAFLTRGQVSPIEGPVTEASKAPTPEAAEHDGVAPEDPVDEETPR